MHPTYVPIIKAKPGEFMALTKLKDQYSQKIFPFFEVPKITDKTKELASLRGSNQLTRDYLDLIASGISNSCKSSAMFFDLFEWKPDIYVETGEHTYSYMYRNLSAKGLSVYPVIGFDRWPDTDYKNAIKSLIVPEGITYCLRIDSVSLDDAYDVDYFVDTINEIMGELRLSGKELMILLDFGDVTRKSIVSLQADMQHLLKIIKEFECDAILIAGCSFPILINDAVKNEDSTDFVERREMITWKILSEEYDMKLIFADYGIRNPSGANDIITKHVNGKIRHTINNKYFVARGHSKQKGNKGEQIYDLAHTIINSPFYLGEGFSWGDERILACSRKELRGRAQDWISFDTNHHISFVVEEILEFKRQKATTKNNTKIL
ncbi:hypothetical protein KD5_04900 [Yersinia pseudotuberculosis]|uniref:beta family protein n=1 Tax=Yersinia pseudotuberculosis TaxID=633 RepID=UPI00061BC107|nr:beta family protein [Yersinia pseudotuberculosis]CNL18917.1 Uncharacterised protein [Yersinia pseudotuberculosis]